MVGGAPVRGGRLLSRAKRKANLARRMIVMVCDGARATDDCDGAHSAQRAIERAMSWQASGEERKD